MLTYKTLAEFFLPGILKTLGNCCTAMNIERSLLAEAPFPLYSLS